jgi:hypothetical protein
MAELLHQEKAYFPFDTYCQLALQKSCAVYNFMYTAWVLTAWTAMALFNKLIKLLVRLIISSNI